MQKRPQVVIVGGGFGGLTAARTLRRAPVDVTIIDRTNHHVFQPLLYQVATATLAPTDITAPIRWLVRNDPRTEVLMADVDAVDADRRVVRLGDGQELRYDYLILAAGARHSYFGHGDWEHDAPGLKSIADALDVRRRFLSAFERAELTDDPTERDALLTFVIVGAGPTGVELAGMLPTIATRTLQREFRRIDTSKTRVLLVEGGPRVLPSFPEALARHAEADLRQLGVDVRVGARVTGVSADHVEIEGERVPTRTVFWAAGNAAAPVGRSIGVPLDRSGRVKVHDDLSVPGHRELFVVGDLAEMSSNGKPVPGVAQGAIQSGRRAAKNILLDLRGEPRQAFRYRDKGNLATIGRNKAIADFGRFQMAGRPAWWFWLFLHILYLAGFRNRLSVLVQWGYAYFTYQRGARLLAGDHAAVTAAPSIMPKW